MTTQLAVQPVTALLDAAFICGCRWPTSLSPAGAAIARAPLPGRVCCARRRLLAGAEHGVSDFTAQVEGDAALSNCATAGANRRLGRCHDSDFSRRRIYTVAIPAMASSQDFSRSFDATAALRLATAFARRHSRSRRRDLRALAVRV